MLSKSKTLIALFAVLALLAAACGGDDDAGGDGDSKICEVTDVGGVDDKGFNASAWAGAQRAADDFSAEAKVL